MAMEAIKLIVGLGTPLIGRMLLYDGRESRFDEIALS
jgi:molybdopterin/thiamine biosynthesis adenylyltransferase